MQLRHTLDVQFAPTVRALVPPEQHVAKGNSVTLECKAFGNPEPNIRWSHQEGTLPSGYHTSQVRLKALSITTHSPTRAFINPTPVPLCLFRDASLMSQLNN